MTYNATSSTAPSFLYGSSIKSSVQVGQAEAEAESVSMTKENTSAKESLLFIQRDVQDLDPKGRSSSRKDLYSTHENADPSLLRKGILMNHSKPCTPFRPSEEIKKEATPGDLKLLGLIQNNIGCENSAGNLVLVAHDNSSSVEPSLLPFIQREGPGSPDSGYGNTPEVGFRPNLTFPSSRSRSSSSETNATSNDDTTSTRRTPNSSGVPSSLWSGHESTLEFVTEEEGNMEEDTEDKTRGISSNSEEEGNNCPQDFPSEDPQTSILGPLPTFNLDPSNDYHSINGSQGSDANNPYFHPDESTLIRVAKRKGITHSTSMENEIKGHFVMVEESQQVVNEMESMQNHRISKTEGRRRRTMGRRRAQSVIKEASGRHAFLMEGKDTFQIQDDLSKDNHHFTLSEALISVIEEYKSQLHEKAYDQYLTRRSSCSSGSGTLCSPIHQDYTLLPESLTRTVVQSDGEDEIDLEMGGARRNIEYTPLSIRQSTTSLHQKWLEENYRASISSGSSMGQADLLHLMNSPSARNSAEGTANGLLQHVAKVLGGNAQVEFRVPQVIQLPAEFVTSIKREELLQYSVSDNSSPIRGNTDWAPPRQQVIHTVYSQPKDCYSAFTHQGGRCAGCGMRMDISQPKSFRFCNYTGKYFCVSCHHNPVSFIPAHIISKWSFKRLPVSNFARDTLSNIEKMPLFNLESLNATLYEKVPELNKIREYRIQLQSLRKYISTCSRAEKLLEEYDDFGHWTNGDIHLYSLSDFMLVRSGNLLKELKDLISESEKHIKSCPVCQGKGFVCEFCQNEKNIIFPFQLNIVSQCPECHSCFHKSCHNKRPCPRCERIKERRQQRLRKVMNINQDSDV